MAIVSGVSAVVEHTYLVIGPCTHVVTCLPEFPAVVLPLDSTGGYLSEAYRRHVSEKSVIYRKREGELREYEKRVNSAAGELCLRDVSLLVKRGKLLQLEKGGR